MFQNYLKTAFRNLKKTKLFSLINIFGLAIGMAAFLFIWHYVNFEKSYDQFHENYDRIYRLRYERTDGKGDAVRFASCCPPAAVRIRDKYPEVEKIGRMLHYDAVVSVENIYFMETRMFFAEPEILEILKINRLHGDFQNSLQAPNQALMSATTAHKYFGAADPLGKTITVDKKTDYRIVGLFADTPANSHVKFDILLPWKNLEAQFGPDYYEAWGHTGSFTYLMAKPGTDPRAFEKKLLPLIQAECPWLKEYNMTIDLIMQPLAEIHLTSHFMQELEPNGDRNSVNFLFIIAFFIIIMAWVNYVNLSTARSLNRAKEVGLRKVVGASRQQLMLQFFFETILINFFSIVLAMGLIKIFLPLFRHISGVPAEFGIWTQGWFWLALVILFFAGVFLSGLYPVVILSSFKPITVLRGKLGNATRGLNLRKTLVTFQFAIAIILITATLAVFRQIAFMRTQDLGFDISQTLVIRAPRVRDDNYGSKFDTFRQMLLQRADIEKVCHVTEVPGRQIYWDAGGIMKLGEDDTHSKNYQIVGIDYDFADFFDLKFVAGRNFSREFPADKDALIFNETAVQWMGFPDAKSAIGQQVSYWDQIYTIVGVLKDYHQQSPKVKFEPHIFRFLPYGRDVRGMMAIKMNIKNIQETVDFTKKLYSKFFPGNPFDYFFLDDYYNQQYQSDQQFGQVFSLFATLAIIITALGIFGLSFSSATQRTKEIGIRKVLGANIPNILLLLSRDFLKLLLIAFAVALIPLIYGINKWLESFATRMTFSGWLYLIPFVVVLVVMILTISVHVIKAALANPIQSLRYE
ncbi:ABC transporter permease [candidate division KSB1 bacterium]|nr:ABC transporter permease [candidate division KSB1 bacterium]